MADHAAQTVDERGERDGARGVAVPVHLVPRAAEVEHRAALRLVDRDLEPDPRPVVHRILRGQDGFPCFFSRFLSYFSEHVTHGKLSILLQEKGS